jgi:hypothetical protein
MKGRAMDMDVFFRDQNIERYRRLASAGITEAERKTLLGVLAKVEDMCIERQKANTKRV